MAPQGFLVSAGGAADTPREPFAALEAGAMVAEGYEVVEHLWRGRRLDVYDVWSPERYCRCIVKTLRPDRAHDAKAARLLRLEGRLLTSLTHPHLVRSYGVVVTIEAPRPALILETLSGKTVEA